MIGLSMSSEDIDACMPNVDFGDGVGLLPCAIVQSNLAPHILPEVMIFVLRGRLEEPPSDAHIECEEQVPRFVTITGVDEHGPQMMQDCYQEIMNVDFEIGVDKKY